VLELEATSTQAKSILCDPSSSKPTGQSSSATHPHQILDKQCTLSVRKVLDNATFDRLELDFGSPLHKFLSFKGVFRDDEEDRHGDNGAYKQDTEHGDTDEDEDNARENAAVAGDQKRKSGSQVAFVPTVYKVSLL
jgi:hypothetical protein